MIDRPTDPFVMEDKDLTWLDDSYKLDAESPLAITRSLWHGLAQSEEDSRYLFASTPPTSDHSMELNQILDSFCKKETEAGRGLYSNATTQEESPRFKRRRMLHFPSDRDESNPCDTTMDTSMDGMETHIQDSEGSMMSPCEDLERFEAHAPPSPNASWIFGNVESQFIVDGTMEPISDKWISSSFVETHGHRQVVPVNEISGSCSINQQEFELLECPSNDIGVPFTPGGRSAGQYTQPKSLTPPAYPFNNQKPSRAQGEVTLTDINLKLEATTDINQKLASSKQPGFPQLVQTVAGGFSGKSVLHSTRIHTPEGWIHIRRTRG